MIGRFRGRKQILSEHEQELRAREQELLGRVGVALERFGGDAAPEDVRRL